MPCTWKWAGVCWSNPRKLERSWNLNPAGRRTSVAPFRFDIRDKMMKGFLTALLSLLCPGLYAAAISVAPGELEEALADAPDGAVMAIQPGVHTGNFRIEKPVTLIGEEGAIVDGGGQGHILWIDAPDVTIRNLHLRNSGVNLTDTDAAIYTTRDATGVRLIDNRIEARGFGIWLHGSHEALVEGNHISGDITLRHQDRGNGIHLFNTRHSLVKNNVVWETRDGIYIDFSHNNRLEGNHLHSQRYGVHYMNSNDNEVVGNRSWNNRAGFALMQSRRLDIIGNHSEGDEGYGFLINDMQDSTITDNTAIAITASTNPRTGTPIRGSEGKAMFIYNSQFNTFRRNHLERTDIGIHLTAGSENNEIHENALINNRSQVMYVATRKQEWSIDGRGNYWSDYIGWDLAGDGIGDVPHEPNDAVDRLFWTYPMARILMNSPAVQLLRWVQREFPVLRPPGVTDSAPLMRPAPQQDFST